MTARSSDGLDPRRRKLLFRCWHRGIPEVDLIMGRFADAAVDELSDDELAEFERLIEVPDHDVLAWVTGEAAYRQPRHAVVSPVARFQPARGGRELSHGALPAELLRPGAR